MNLMTTISNLANLPLHMRRASDIFLYENSFLLLVDFVDGKDLLELRIEFNYQTHDCNAVLTRLTKMVNETLNITKEHFTSIVSLFSFLEVPYSLESLDFSNKYSLRALSRFSNIHYIDESGPVHINYENILSKLDLLEKYLDTLGLNCDEDGNANTEPDDLEAQETEEENRRLNEYFDPKNFPPSDEEE